MITIFRRLRQKLIDSGNITRYLIYAVGEILLVVIGILIALQINNWNETRIDHTLENRFLNELLLDLRADSLTLNELKKQSDRQVFAKQHLMSYYKSEELSNDSLATYFVNSSLPTYSFRPLTTTLDEMKSTGSLKVITNSDLRRSILKTYNKYDVFITGFQDVYTSLQQEAWNYYLQNINQFRSTEYDQLTRNIRETLQDFRVENYLVNNYVVTLNTALAEIIHTNRELISKTRAELSRINGDL